MTTFDELMESGKKLEKLKQECNIKNQDVIEALNVLISWCETETNEENLPMNRNESQ